MSIIFTIIITIIIKPVLEISLFLTSHCFYFAFRDTFAVVPKFPCLSVFKIQRKVKHYVLEESEI